jgi:hypothetical protein
VADRVLRRADIVVDGLWNADQVEPALLRDAAHDVEAAVAADRDQRLHAELAQPVDDLARAVAPAAVRHRKGEGIAAVGGAEHGAAEAQQVGRSKPLVQFLKLQWPTQQPHRAIADAEDAPAIARDGAGHDAANDCVEPGAVAATGQQADGLALRVGLPRQVGHAACSPAATIGRPCKAKAAISDRKRRSGETVSANHLQPGSGARLAAPFLGTVTNACFV